MDSLTSLTNLMVGADPAGVNDCTGGTNNAAQLFSQCFSQLDAACDVFADTTANGDNDVSADQVNQLLSRDLHSFPTRRSSDLMENAGVSTTRASALA